MPNLLAKKLNEIRKIAYQCRQIILKKLNLVSRNMIYYEGGLGSQILSHIDYLEKLKSSNYKVWANLDYFKNYDQDFTNVNGLSIWTWKLDRYGIAKNSLKTPNKFIYLVNRYLMTRPLINRSNYEKFREKKSQSYQDIFPINQEKLDKYLINVKKNKDKDYAVIHIRRGDYVKVASELQSVEDVTCLITKIKKLLPKFIFITSDSILFDHEINALNFALINHDCFYVDHSEDLFLVHDLMRCSVILVGSNSTYSFTAGLLSSPQTLLYFPTRYFGGGQINDAQAFHYRQLFGYLMG